jgi:hypothetical protein
VVAIELPFHVPDTTVPREDAVTTLRLSELTLPDVWKVPAVELPVVSIDAALTLPEV